jgi:PAS domain S-box-containing protein
MTGAMRKTGVDLVGDIPWGTHFCLFYESKADLLEIAVSYCKAGLEGREYCLWVVAEPLTVEDARLALERALPDFDRYFADHSIEIVAARDWYLLNGTFDIQRVISGWNEKLERASARGYAGVRVTGDTAWLEKKDWKDFCEYEDSLNQAVANKRLTVLCTYPLAACGAHEILDVVRTHQYAVTKRRGEWEVIETAGLKQAKAEIKRLNEELEQRVLERTSQLTSLNRELTKEVILRQRAEEALRRSEAYLAEAQRVSHTGSFGWSVSGGEIVWSEETFRIFDCDPAHPPTLELILQRTHPEDRAFVQEKIDQVVLERKAFEFEHRLLMPDSSVKHVRVVGHPSTNDDSRSFEFVGAVMDITEAKQVERTLREREAYLEEAQRLTHTGSGAWRVPGWEAVYLSDEWYRIYGFDPKIGLRAWKERLQRMHPEDRDKVQEIKDWATRQKSEYEVDHRIIHPDGTLRYTHTVGHPVLNASGEVEQYVCTMMDVTERKRAEESREALREAQEDLARMSRLTTMGELTASLAHEVNQPIAAASTNAKTCLRWLAGDTPNIEEASAAAMRLVKDVKRAAEIIGRIRELFAKDGSQRELVDINEIIQGMIVLLRGETAQHNIIVSTDLAEDIPQFMADRVHLQQVLMNLIINGIEAMKDIDRARELTVTSQRAGTQQVLVSVNDTGVGLPSPLKEHIFNAFFSTKPHGIGMGLRISRSIVESHGGRLWADDNSPYGASFRFTLSTEATELDDSRNQKSQLSPPVSLP